MKSVNFTQLLMFVLISVTLTGCELVGDIFEVGLWAGVIIVVLVIVLIVWLIRKFMD